jgi:bifunctional non-homologous end joining protein LigD
MLADLIRQLRPLEAGTSPFGTPVPAQHARDAHWTEPRLVGEVTFTEWTSDGSMRHPSWRGLRPGKSPGEVRLKSQIRKSTSSRAQPQRLLLFGPV